jgi:hypothetical protein
VRPAALALIACAAVAAGCGDSDDEPSAGGDPATTELEIAVEVDATAPNPAQAMVASVSCPGDPPEVCDAVAALPDDPGAPTDPQTACTEIYGGPDVLTVAGTLRGEPIDATFTRENGCEIERFDRFSELLAALFPGYEPGASLAP